jgi:hypothetical protein
LEGKNGKGKIMKYKRGRPSSMDAEADAQFVATLKAHQASKDAVPIAESKTTNTNGCKIEVFPVSQAILHMGMSSDCLQLGADG